MEVEDIIDKLENLVLMRFKNLKEIKLELKQIFPKLNLDGCKKTKYSDEFEQDFIYIGNLNNKENIYCDFDIYYIFDNAKNLVITEVGYEFE